MYMEPNDHAIRESFDLIINPYYSDDALYRFQQWIERAADLDDLPNQVNGHDISLEQNKSY